MIQIFYTNISKKNHDYILEIASKKFSKDFYNKVLKYKRWEDIQLTLLGRIMVFDGIYKIFNEYYSDTDLHYSKYGKPFLNNEIDFNISHSGKIVVCAITKKNEIGIDIEEISDLKIDDYKEYLTHLEWDKIKKSSSTKKTFFDYWTQKEAVIKSHGKGLSINLSSFEIMNNKTKINNDLFYLKKIKINKNYMCSICMRKNNPDIKITKLNLHENH